MNGRKIVCICGSTKQADEFIEANRKETMQGNIVLTVGVFAGSGQKVHGRDIELSEHEKLELDALHKDKIRLADEVLFIKKPDGSFGSSTDSEHEFAKELKKPIRYF